MKKLGRLLIILMGALIGFAILILLGVNLYVQSQGTQARIQQELSQRLGTTLRIRRISVTPWAGLKLTGITIPQTQAGITADFLTAKTFRLRIQFKSLFARRLVIKEISLISPNVVWAQNEDGKWRIPSSQVVAEMSDPLSVNGTTLASPAPSVQEKGSTPELASINEFDADPTDSDRPAPFTPEIRRVNLVHGRFQFLDQKLKNVATFDDVQFRSEFRTATDLRGKILIAKTSLRDRFFLEQLESPVRYAPDEMDLSQITARIAGGEVMGQFTLLPQTENSPFTVGVKFRGIEADTLLVNAGGARGMVTGQLEGRLDASGATANSNALTGSGEIVLHDGKVQQYSLLVALGELLQIEDLRNLKFDQAEVKYRINPGVITIDELLLRSQNIRLSAFGNISFDGRLRLESRLAINEKLLGQLFRMIQDNFQPIDEPGYSAVRFQVSGTIDRPKSNLMEKLVGRDLKDLGSMLSTLIGAGKGDKSKKKKPAETTETVTEPTSSPASGVESPSPAGTP